MLAGVAFTQAGAGLGPVRLKLGGKVGQTNEYSMMKGRLRYPSVMLRMPPPLNRAGVLWD